MTINYETWTKALAELPIDCVAVGIHDDGELTPEARTLDLRCREKLSRLAKRGDFGGKPGETWLVTDLEGVRAERVLLVGLGPKGTDLKEGVTRKLWRRALVAAVSAASRTRITALGLALPRPAAKALSDERFGRAVAELTGQTLYRINDLKSGKKPRPHALARVVAVVAAKAAPAVKKGFSQGAALTRGAGLMRNLANLPPNVCTPTYLGKTAESLAREHKSLKVKVLGLPEIKREKMGCFLAVTQGSEEPPRFIVVEHRHPNGSSVTTVRSGATSCANRLTRCTSVATAQTLPSGLERTTSMMRSVEPLSSAACTTSNVHSGCAITLPWGCCFRKASICCTVKRVWTEQCPFHSRSFACSTIAGVSPPWISLGSHTAIRSSGIPILKSVLRPRC